VKINLSQDHEAVSERPQSKDVPFLPRLGKCRWALSSHERSYSEKDIQTYFAHLGKAVVRCLLQFQEIFTFKSPDDVQIQSRFGAFFRGVTETQESVPWSSVAQGWLVVPDKGLSSGAEESGGVFSNSPNLQVAKCDA